MPFNYRLNTLVEFRNDTNQEEPDVPAHSAGNDKPPFHDEQRTPLDEEMQLALDADDERDQRKAYRENLMAREIESGLVPVPTVAVTIKPNGPGPMAHEAYHGIVGEFVKLVEPHSEADPAALAISLLIACGNYLSRTTYYLADGSKHFPNEFAVIVGDSAKGRKGTSWNRVKQVLQKADPDYYTARCMGGLSSGEGVIWAVRDPIIKQEPVKKNGRIEDYQEVIADAGVEDKRLLVIEGEFVRCLQAMKREGNTLSAITRESWDSGNLNILTKNNAATATDAHISIVAHITVEELLRHLSATDSANGFANRFLWIYVRRSKCLPFGGELTEEALDPIAARLLNVAQFAQSCQQMRFDVEAAAHWQEVYPQLSEGGKGLAGVITSRNEAHAVRLAALYALLDLSPEIKLEHLRAALAVVDYSTRSVQFIFGGKLGDDTADTIWQVLIAAGDNGMTRNDLYNHFGKNKSSGEIGRALGILKKDGLAFMREESTGGRKAERWYVVREKGGSGGQSSTQMELFT